MHYMKRSVAGLGCLCVVDSQQNFHTLRQSWQTTSFTVAFPYSEIQVLSDCLRQTRFLQINGYTTEWSLMESTPIQLR